MVNFSILINHITARVLRISGPIRAQWLSWLVFIVSLVITYHVWSNAQYNTMQIQKVEFNWIVNNVDAEIGKRINTYEQVMRGLDGLFSRDTLVTRNEFHDYIDKLNLVESYPGIMSIRFIPIIPMIEKDLHIAALRKEGFSAYTIFPEGQRDIYAPVVYVEPFANHNQEVLGHDMLSDLKFPFPGESPGVRFTSMEQARDSGNVTVSGKVRLGSETGKDGQSYFMMFLPLYKYNSPHATLDERRHNIRGWICSVLSTNEVMNGIVNQYPEINTHVDIEIYDDTEMSMQSMVYDADHCGTGINYRDTCLQQIKTIKISGHPWTVMIHSLFNAAGETNGEKSLIIIGSGVGLSLFFTIFTWLLIRDRMRALQATLAVKQISRKNEMLLRTASDGIYIFDRESNLLQVNDAFCRMLGYTQAEMLSMNVTQWNAQWSKEQNMRRIDALGNTNQTFETLHRHCDGHVIDVEVNASRITIDGQELICNSVRNITNRKRMDRELRASEERWSFALEGSGDGVWDWDLQTGEIVFSARYKEILGFPRETNWKNLADWKNRVDPRDMQQAMSNLEAYLDGKFPTYAVEYRMLCQDGSWKWILSRGMVVNHADDGRPLRMIGTHTDITERKHIIEAIRKSEAQLRLLLDSAAEAIYGVDVQENCTFCNPSCVRLLGYQSADKLIGRNMHELIHYQRTNGNPFPAEQCPIVQVIQTGKRAHVDHEVFWRADGTSFFAEYWSYPQVFDDVIVGAVVTFLDITERVLANEKLLKLSRAVENSPASVLITDPKGTIEYVNQKFTTVTGYLAHEIIGQNTRILNSGKNSREFYQNMWETISSGNEWRGEICNVKKNGELYLEYALISPIRDDSGVITHFVAVKEDITKQKRIEQDLKKALADADSANRAKSDFLANMSHELRTPMNAIIGFSHLCLQTDLSPKQSSYLHKVNVSAKTLLNIINDILDLSKIEAGKMELEQIQFRLEHVMGNLATVISTRTEEKGLELLFNISPQVHHHLVGDPLRLGQVLLNLAGNAVKFTDHGEVVVLIEVERETVEHVTLRFTIQDTGIGMTQEQTNKLFQAFTQADTTTTRKFGGTGLGLSISKKLVSLMNGEIWVESTPEVGSRFIFVVGFQKVIEPLSAARYLPNPDLRGLRVLVVDDNENYRRILESYLTLFTFQVTNAPDGFEALQIIQQASQNGRTYHLIILDWKMPGLSGIEVARKIREMVDLTKAPKILLLSSFNQNEITQNLEHDIVNGILAKPFQINELFNTIMDIFGRGSLQEDIDTETEDLGKIKAKLHTLRGTQVLLVEDNSINQELASELLSEFQIVVTLAENGEQALQCIQKQDFDLVLMDIQMPGMNGLETTHHIRDNPRFRERPPIIAMTANALLEDREKSLSAGMQDHLDKPIDPRALYEVLITWIAPRSASNKCESLPAPPLANGDLGEIILPSLLSGVNIRSGLSHLTGNRRLYIRLLSRFRNMNSGVIDELKRLLANGELNTARRVLHTLKGNAGNLGMDTLYQVAIETEKNWEKAGSPERMGQLLLPLKHSLDIVLSSLATLPKELDSTAVAAATSIDPHRILFLTGEMITLLDQDIAQVMDHMEELRTLLRGTPHHSLCNNVATSLEEFDTDRAQELLQELRATFSIGV
ncbi:two-component system, sensor histidine kinase and response regulator [Gammaproteobacteria bacterium]